MKKVLILGYIAAALIISNYANASISYDAPAEIESASFDPSTSSLRVFGSLPNPCAKSRAILLQNEFNPEQLTLVISTVKEQDICISVRDEFDVSISMKELARMSRLQLNPGATYRVKTANFNYEFEISGLDLLN